MLIINRLIVPLLLTIGVEWIVLILLTGFKTRLLLGVAAINMATNPLLNFILFFASQLTRVTQTGAVVIALEILVVGIEWLLLNYITQKNTARTLLYSLLMNLSSYLIGVIFL